MILSSCLALSACYGTGLSELNTHSFWTTETPEDKQQESWWDHFYGHKPNTPESTAWKDWYKGPNEQSVGKPDYCGYWGNCPTAGTASESSSCVFYGNCPKQ